MTHLTIANASFISAEIETVETILRRKGRNVWTIRPDATVFEAIGMMEEKEIGALIVMEDGAIAGLVSERDYARKIALKGRQSKETKVAEIMTRPVVTVTPEWRVDDCLKLVTERRVRHLPVMEKDKLAGVISIGDLVNSTIHTLSDTVNQLNAYISGEYPN